MPPFGPMPHPPQFKPSLEHIGLKTIFLNEACKTFKRKHFERIDIDRKDPLSRYSFKECRFSMCSVVGVDLRDCTFIRNSYESVSLINTDLSGSVFEGFGTYGLSHLSLSECILKGVEGLPVLPDAEERLKFLAKYLLSDRSLLTKRRISEWVEIIDSTCFRYLVGQYGRSVATILMLGLDIAPYIAPSHNVFIPLRNDKIIKFLEGVVKFGVLKAPEAPEAA